MRIALLQLNFTVGDLDGNASKIESAVREAAKQNVDLCLTSELALQGYPPRDLLLYREFVDRSEAALRKLATELADGPPLLIGTAIRNVSGKGRGLYNAACLLAQGTIHSSYLKSLLPTYDVFDEDRYFERGSTSNPLHLGGMEIGVTICEDIWNDKDFWLHPRYGSDPVERLASGSSLGLLVNLSGSPFTLGKQQFREEMLRSIALKYHTSICYVNQVGGNDDLVFDGRSCVIDTNGETIARAKSFEEDILVVEFPAGRGRLEDDDFSVESEAWRALVLGTRDYAQKCGFKKALLGLSGGIDSALTAAIAVEALGKDNVLGVMMPSPHSSAGSVDDSVALSQNLGMQIQTLPIGPIMRVFDTTLADSFSGYQPDVTEENIQSRIRGNLLMALSNKYSSLLLTTGNKSEMAVGYCTIYGDMAGGLAVLADVPKILVYKLSRWLSKTRMNVIPGAIIDKAPSAELKPGQKDQDSLPPYDILDAILQMRIEQHASERELLDAGFEAETLRKVLRLIKIAEFKRKQAAPGIKITDRAFGTGWRLPIASRQDF